VRRECLAGLTADIPLEDEAVSSGGFRDSIGSMTEPNRHNTQTRRELLCRTAAGAAVWAAGVAWPGLASASDNPEASANAETGEEQLYSGTLRIWCDGLLERQITEMREPAFYGGLLCPACAFIHGRCGDAVYPLLRMAHTTGEAKYVRAAMLVHEWSQAQVSRADGSWVNDVTLSTWQGITVFHTIALAEALEHHGEVLDAATRAKWKDRLAAAAKFLDGFITIETGNVNYPVTATLAFQLSGRVLADAHYFDRAHTLAQEVMGQFTPNGFLFGEGHPLKGISAKGCRPVDLGYNVEESLPSLALYSLLADDKPVQEQVVAAMKTHMEFMLPDGAWDNSWGSRNYKWSWWGSRTSDGCEPGFVLMAKFDPRFREAARRNLELMAACTHNGLLYGGPDFFAHGDLPCIHHTFTHAKALAAVLDRGNFGVETDTRPKLPRDEAYGLKNFPPIGTKLAAVGPWRATVTEYDWEYTEHVQPGAGNLGGGHVSGGALSLLYHETLGPICTASMTEYQMVEIANQQQFREGPHMDLTPRMEYATSGERFTNLNDFKAVLTASQQGEQVVFNAEGQLMTPSRKPLSEAMTPSAGSAGYRMEYRIGESTAEIAASFIGFTNNGTPRLIVPVIARAGEHAETVDAKTVRVVKSKGALIVTTDAADGFDSAAIKEKTFNLVPGFEAVPLTVAVPPGKMVRVQLRAELSQPVKERGLPGARAARQTA
jgi:hypothetical protein